MGLSCVSIFENINFEGYQLRVNNVLGLWLMIGVKVRGMVEDIWNK